MGDAAATPDALAEALATARTKTAHLPTPGERAAHVVATCYLSNLEDAKGEHALCLAKAFKDAAGTQSLTGFARATGRRGGNSLGHKTTSLPTGRRRGCMITITSDTLLWHTDRHARVTAGPGAGKTYWLVQHATNVLRRSIKLHPHARLGIISYTNVAADSLRENLGANTDRAHIGMIHSFLYHNVIKPYLYLVRS